LSQGINTSLKETSSHVQCSFRLAAVSPVATLSVFARVSYAVWSNTVVVACGSAGKLPVVELRGFELTEDYLVQNGFRRPLMVRCKDGLDLRVPDENFSIHDVEEHVGMSRLVCNCFYCMAIRLMWNKSELEGYTVWLVKRRK